MCTVILKTSLKSESEINWENFKSFCNVLHEDGTEKENAFFASSVRTDGTVNVMSGDPSLNCLRNMYSDRAVN